MQDTSMKSKIFIRGLRLSKQEFSYLQIRKKSALLTFAIWSNFPKSSFNMWTSSPGEQSLARRVNPTMSAYKILWGQGRKWQYYKLGSANQAMKTFQFSRLHIYIIIINMPFLLAGGDRNIWLALPAYMLIFVAKMEICWEGKYVLVLCLARSISVPMSWSALYGVHPHFHNWQDSYDQMDMFLLEFILYRFLT